MQIYNVTHEADLDGIGCAAMLVRNYRVPLRNLVFLNYEKRSFERGMKEILDMKPRDGMVVFSDFGMNDRLVPIAKRTLAALKRSGNRILWIDHHPWSDRAIASVKSLCDVMVVGENEKYCATELVYRLLCDRDAFGDRFMKLVHASDFALMTRNEPTIRRLALAIKVMNWGNRDSNLRKLAGQMAEGMLTSPFIEAAHRKYLAESKANLKVLKDSLVLANPGRYTIGFGFSTRLNTNAACEAIDRELHTDIRMYVDRVSGTAHLRSSKGVDCSRIAVFMGGGGHPQACGFQFDMKEFDNLSEKGIAKYVDRMMDVAKKVYR
ncbi:MAG: hypothetical protein KGH98_02915 [Candidatus Micrarchaeota archaeon]|nr:hypothetical protein [Candidatus Micrarchaeota archaeon]